MYSPQVNDANSTWNVSTHGVPRCRRVWLTQKIKKKQPIKADASHELAFYDMAAAVDMVI